MSQYRSQEKHDKSQCDNGDDEAYGGPWDGVILHYGDPHLIQSGPGLARPGWAPGTILTDY